MAEVRATAESGGQKGIKTQRLSLIPWLSVWKISEVYNFGAKKYADHNWRKGYPWSWSYDALIRHLTAWWEGEDTDSESGLSHLAHAGFHVLTLLWFQAFGRGTDDRWRPSAGTAFCADGTIKTEGDVHSGPDAGVPEVQLPSVLRRGGLFTAPWMGVHQPGTDGHGSAPGRAGSGQAPVASDVDVRGQGPEGDPLSGPDGFR